MAHLGELATVEPPAALMLARVIDQARSAERISSSELRGEKASCLGCAGAKFVGHGRRGARIPRRITAWQNQDLSRYLLL